MAITTLGLTGFEHGYIGAGAQNGGGLFDAAPGSGWQVTTTAVRNGTYAARLIAPASTSTTLQTNFAVSQTKVVVRLGLKVSARPSTSAWLLSFAVGGGTANMTISSTGQLAVNFAASGAVNGPIIDTTNWHLVELQIDTAAKTWDWKVDGVAQPQATGAGAPTAATIFFLGTTSTGSNAFTADYDDVIVGTWTVAATDWYGDGKVLRQLAGSDGTHATITSLSPGDAATAYSGTVTTAYTMVDDVPGGGAWTNSRTTTDNLALRTATVGAYAEIKPATTAETRSANAVKAIMSYSSSATQANLAACDVRNSAGAVKELWGLTGGVGQDYSETTNFFKSAIVTAPAAGWTAAEVNAIRFRFGGCTSADISPVPTVQGLMLEVDWPTWVTPTATPVARVSLASAGTPDTRTAHSIKVRARKQSGTGTVLLNAALYEGSTNRSGDLASSALTTSLADYTLAIPDASAANITDYGNLELRFWGSSSSGDAVVVEVARIALVAPYSTPPSPLYETVLDDFTRADGLITAGAGAAIWNTGRVSSATTTALSVASNQLRGPAAALSDAHSKALADADMDLLVDLPVAMVTAEASKVRLYCSILNPGSISVSGYYLEVARVSGGLEDWTIYTMDNGVGDTPLRQTLGQAALPAGASIWLRRRGGKVMGLRRDSAGGAWAEVVTITDSIYYRAGTIGVHVSSSSTGTVRVDNLRGGRFQIATTHYGVVDRSTTFGAVTQARRKTFGQVAAPLTVGVATQGASAYPDVILATPGLLSYWRLNEAAGNALDSKGTNHGTVGSGVTRSVPGLLSRGGDTAMQGNGGTTSSVVIPTSASLDVTSQATVELWVKPVAMVATVTVINRGTDNAFAIRQYSAGDGRWEFQFWDVNGVRRSSTANLPVAEVGKRQHLVMTYDAAGTLRTYVDGALIGTPVTCDANIRTGGALVIFDRSNGSGTGFAGVVDEVALYNVVLTPQQVAAHFAIGAPPVTLYGATATSVGFGAVTQGLRKAKGITAAPFTFGAVTQAQRRTTSALVAPTTFGAVTQARRKTFSSTVTPTSFGAVTQARRRTTSALVAPSTFGAVVQGQRKSFGIVARATSFGATTAGVASTPAPLGAYYDEVLADSPISYWRLGDNVTIHDEMGAVPDATAYGGWAADGLLTGDPDGSILFDGSDDIITFPNVAAHAVNSGSLELWVKTIEFGVGGSYRGMLVKSEAYGIFMQDNQLMTYDWGGGGNRLSGVFLNDNVRHHVVLTFQSGVAGGSQLYCDGVAVGAPFSLTVGNQGASGFHIAANAGVQLFRGHLDECAFYGTVLSPARIAAHYQAGATGPAETHYGSSSLTTSFGSATAGQRKAFGQVARPTTLAAVTQGQRTAFGVVARASTFGAATAAQRRTTGVVARATSFGAVTAGQRKALGVVARATAFGAVTAAQRRTTSAVAAPTTFGAVTQGRRRTTSSTATSLTFGAATAGDRAALTKFGAVAATYTLARDTSARRKTFASTATPLTLGIATAGQRVAFGVFGAVAAPFAFGSTTQGRRRTTSAVAVPATFGAVVQGRRRTTSALVMPVAYGAVTQAKRRTTGVVDRATTLGAVTAARKHTYAALVAPTTFGAVLKAKIHTRGQVVMPTTFGIATAGIRPVAGGYGSTSSVYAFGSTTQARRKTFGLVARPVTLGAVTQARRRTTSGLVMPVGFGALTAAQRRTTSALLVPITFAKATQAQRQTFGRVAMPLALVPVVSGGQRRAFAQVALPITFAALLQARRRTFGSLDVPITVAVTTRGRTLVATVVLNDADMVYLSGQAAEEVAVGAEQVWPED